MTEFSALIHNISNPKLCNSCVWNKKKKRQYKHLRECITSYYISLFLILPHFQPRDSKSMLHYKQNRQNMLVITKSRYKMNSIINFKSKIALQIYC